MKPRILLPLSIAGLLISSCSRPKAPEPLEMHIVQTSYLSRNPKWGPIENPGSLVITISSGKATGELLHVAKGEAKSLSLFQFDASKHTFLSSTPTVETRASRDVDVSFVQDADAEFQDEKSKEITLQNVFEVSRSGNLGSLHEGVHILYRIQRTNSEQDRWRSPHEKSLQSMIDTSKQLDCEYIVLNVKGQR